MNDVTSLLLLLLLFLTGPMCAPGHDHLKSNRPRCYQKLVQILSNIKHQSLSVKTMTAIALKQQTTLLLKTGTNTEKSNGNLRKFSERCFYHIKNNRPRCQQKLVQTLKNETSVTRKTLATNHLKNAYHLYSNLYMVWNSCEVEKKSEMLNKQEKGKKRGK